MHVYLEINIANAHRKVFSTPECPTGASICSFHFKLPFCVYVCTDFMGKISSDDNDLGALVKDSRLDCSVVDMDIDLPKWQGELC
jgi:hypothetical protein